MADNPVKQVKATTKTMKSAYNAGAQSAKNHPEQTTAQRIARGMGAGFMSGLKSILKI